MHWTAIRPDDNQRFYFAHAARARRLFRGFRLHMLAFHFARQFAFDVLLFFHGQLLACPVQASEGCLSTRRHLVPSFVLLFMYNFSLCLLWAGDLAPP